MSSSNIYSLGFGLSTRNSKKEIIEVFYPNPLLSPSQQLGDAITAVCNTEDEGNGVIELQAATVVSFGHAITGADVGVTVTIAVSEATQVPNVTVT